MKKNGFTLIELLAVIAILGILVAITLPNIVDNYKKSLDKTMQIAEDNVLDAADIYLSEHCLDPMSGYECPSTYDYPSRSGVICLSELINPVSYNEPLSHSSEHYIDEVKYRNTVCEGYVLYNKADNIRKTYLFCGTDYTTNSSEEFVTLKSHCN